MKPGSIGIVGGGPAGLYAALLLKKADPRHHVEVVERNPAGATYGFGVVLSDRTLTNFREADAETFAAITAHQAAWDAVVTYHRGEPVRCAGHEYVGIARKRLLDILQRRCEELGVVLRFETDLKDLASLEGADLVIGADGVNSLVRNRHSEALGPVLTPGRSRYIWLGTDWAPPAFTFVFHKTAHGLFQAHMYPYAEGAGTCVLMCSEATWRCAGLDQASEQESLAFCQALLAPYTGGARVLSNRSLWSVFQTVTCDRWSHGNTVLIGDAAHTAHWSIGSGTKLAMEDAIALVRCLHAHADVPEALRQYEVERKPAVERLQQAGRTSERYCEEIDRQMHLEPSVLAFQLMTRSRRLDYEGLRRRDPDFITSVQATFGGWEPALSPLELRGVRLPNRLVDGSGAGLRIFDSPSPALVDAARARGAVAGLRLGEAADLTAAADAGFAVLELGGAALGRLAEVRRIWPQDRPIIACLPPGAPLEAAAEADVISLESDDPALGEQVRQLAKRPVILRTGSWTGANTLVAGARADLCRLT